LASVRASSGLRKLPRAASISVMVWSLNPRATCPPYPETSHQPVYAVVSGQFRRRIPLAVVHEYGEVAYSSARSHPDETIDSPGNRYRGRSWGSGPSCREGLGTFGITTSLSVPAAITVSSPVTSPLVTYLVCGASFGGAEERISAW
jgi:hypothetical protein